MTLGQGPDLVPGAAAVDAGTDDEGRPLARIERIADRVEHGGVAARRAADAPRLDRLAGAGPVVGRDRDQHRSARRLHREVVAVGDRLRHVFGAGRLAAPLDVGLGQLGRLRREQERVEREQRPRLLAGGDDQRRAVLPGGEDRAHRVADADRRVQVDEGGVAASPSRSRRPCRPPPIPAGRGRIRSRPGSRGTAAARSSRGCRRCAACRTSAATAAPRRARLGEGRSWRGGGAAPLETGGARPVLGVSPIPPVSLGHGGR